MSSTWSYAGLDMQWPKWAENWAQQEILEKIRKSKSMTSPINQHMTRNIGKTSLYQR